MNSTFNADPLLPGQAGSSDGAFPWMPAVIALNLAVFCLHTYLDVRQLRAIKLPEPPAALREHTDLKEFEKTRLYQLDKWWFGLALGIWNEVLGTASLLLLYWPALWRLSARLTAAAGLNPAKQIPVTILFFLLDTLKDTLLGLPWSAWSTFVIEQRHGFNKQTPALFCTDVLKQLALTAAIAPPLLAAFVSILLRGGPWVALYLWAFVFAVSMAFMTLYPSLIAPLFNKFDPLPPGPLRSRIEALAGSLRFPLTQLFVVDGSTRSAHSNAYFYGLFKQKRIVLYDTLLEQCDEAQIEAVLAHELGHWSLSHTAKNLAVLQLHLLSQFLLFTLVGTAPGLFESFGFTQERPAFVAFNLFMAIAAPWNELFGFLMHVLSRRFEFQADAFAVQLGHASSLKEALLILDAKNRSSTNVDPMYSAWHHSHPPLEQRLAAIDAAAKKRR